MALSRIQTDAIEDDAITTAKILDGTVGPSDIGDGELSNTQINASAAIAVSKISGLGTAATIDFGTSANQIVQLDGSGNLPALYASALTNLDAGDLSGNLPAVSGAALTNLTALDLSENDINGSIPESICVETFPESGEFELFAENPTPPPFPKALDASSCRFMV